MLKFIMNSAGSVLGVTAASTIAPLVLVKTGITLDFYIYSIVGLLTLSCGVILIKKFIAK